MITIDNHMHSSFSGDATFPMEEMVEESIKLGLKTITFTDHLDLDYAEEPGLFELDLANYVPKVLQIKETYQKDIEILLGLELGLQPHLAEIHQEIVGSYPWDYVIGSSHVVKGVDPYYPTFWEKVSEEEGYRLYFESILENIHAFNNFDAYGHLDYIVRYGPNKDKFYSYEKYADIIDVVLKAMIVENIALEVNAGAFRNDMAHPNPCEDIIKKYLEFGGQNITIGADAHRPVQIALEYKKLEEILKDCGVKELTVFRKRKPEVGTFLLP